MFADRTAPAVPPTAGRCSPNAPDRSSLTTAIYGLGGLGVVSLTRLLSQALQSCYARTATVESRGIAQRRAPVRATVRAGRAVRSASAPAECVNLVVALEASEALRATLEGKVLRLTQKAGVDGRLFGSVTTHDISEGLTKMGHKIAKSQVRLPNGPLKTVGDHTVSVAPHTDVVAEITVQVIGEQA